MPPPTRREQLELDELLSDIYRGIETLPSKQQKSSSRGGAFLLNADADDNNSRTAGAEVSDRFNNTSNKYLGSADNNRGLKVLRSEVREYELPANSSLVRKHKQELKNLRDQQQQATSPNLSQQPHRSTLKRHTNTQRTATTPEQPAQSLGSFVTSAGTPDNKRRVRIVDHPDKLAKSGKVKYVNTNKLIYHQERNPDDDDEQYADYKEEEYDDEVASSSDSDLATKLEPEDDDVDGVTRVEYYHTSWLDRQLGRASKRRSSKELNERQVKEKAMIEELKSSLKNGAITLRRSFKSKKHNNNKNKQFDSFDDQSRHHFTEKQQDKTPKTSIFKSGLATIPRKPQQQLQQKQYNNDNQASSGIQQMQTKPTGSDIYDSRYLPVTSDYATPIQQQNYEQQQPVGRHEQFSSKTLPHSYNSDYSLGSTRQRQANEAHSLLHSHYRGAKSPSQLHQQRLPLQQQQQFQQVSSPLTSNKMRDPQRQNYACSPSQQSYNYNQSQHQQQAIQATHRQQANTISSMPSATEVVRSALSRSSSQTSLNQLNKTINLLPTSPSPTTPTHQLRANSPSMSPSPVAGGQRQQAYNSNNCYSSNSLSSPRGQQQQSSMVTLHGTRTIPARNQSAQQQQQQPVYANPHASLMQMRQEQQQKRQPSHNQASIREFNELDSLLKSLSPGSVSVTPGYSSRPAAASFGYGGQQQPSTTSMQPNRQPASGGQLYSQVQKQPQQHQHQHQQQQQPFVGNENHSQAFTVDVTRNQDPDYCSQRQELSPFEAPIEILPSMEDYQNIGKLNPVKNHYWYKPKMSRERAIELLKDKPQGTFIVRDSSSFRGAYGLAVKVSKLPKSVLNNSNLRMTLNPSDPSAELIRHFLIEPTSNGGVRLKGYANEPIFNSLPNLIYQHSLTELALPCKLIIPRADIEDPQFKQKQKQFFDDFLASKEMAKHMPYVDYAPNGGYRKYPGNVLVHNEHRIIFE